MAITRAQQAKQMLQNGGMLVQPGFGGTRQGYRGDAAARSTGAAQSGRADPGERGDPGEGANRAGFSAPTRGEPAFTSPDRFVKIDQDVIDREKEFKNFIQAYNKKPPFVGPAVSVLRNIIPGNRKLRSQFINQKLQNQKIKDFYDSLSEDEQDNFDVMQGLSAVGYDQYAADMGSPGLLYSGNVGGLEKFVTGKDEFGNTTFGYRNVGDRDDPSILIPQGIMTQAPSITDQGTEEKDEGLRLAFRADGGPIGGEYDFESARQMYGLGKLVKKVTRTVKKIAKSPIGKAALLYAGAGGLGNLAAGKGFGSFFSGFTSPTKFLGRVPGIFTKGGLQNIASRIGFGSFENIGGERIFQMDKLAPLKAIAGVSAIAGLLTATQEEEAQELARGEGIDIEAARRSILARAQGNIPGDFRATAFRAEGGRIGYQEGSKEPVAKKTMPLLDMGGKEMDLREDGGFVPIGRMEKADDVPARLSKNEFVFTADAVRNAGDGDVDKGAEVMYNMMKNLESGGDVSEESQGLEGARKMFQTSQRLEEVL